MTDKRKRSEQTARKKKVVKKKSKKKSVSRKKTPKSEEKKLTTKQRLFVKEYIVDMNATQAAIRSGYSKNTAGAIGHENLKKPEIAMAIVEAMTKREERVEIDSDYVLKQAVKLHERCMQEVEPFTDRKGNHIHDGEGNGLYVFNAAGSAKALELVGKHTSVQAFKEQVGLSGPNGEPLDTTWNVQVMVPKGNK